MRVRNSAPQIIQRSEAESDNEEDESYLNPKLNPNRITSNKHMIDDINSDLENMSQKDDFSDATSMTSMQSSTERLDTNTEPNTPNEQKIDESKKPKEFDKNGVKKMYQEFSKILLKVKFEKIHNTHKGQDIPAKLLFKECIKASIPQSEWQEFIISELKNPYKYHMILKKSEKKVKNYKAYIK
jgi:hypothetical protein